MAWYQHQRGSPKYLYTKAELLVVLQWATSDRWGNSEMFHPEGQLKAPSTAREAIMAFIGNNQNLLLLADVALGTYVPERQQPAHAAAAQEAVTANITPPAERQVTEEEFEKALIDADAFHNAPPARIWRVAPRETRKTRKTTSVPRDQQQPFHAPSHPESATTNSIPSAEQPANSASSEWGRIDDYSSQDEQRPTRASTQLASTITNTNVFPPAPEQPAQAPRTQGFIAINRAAVAGGPAPIIPRPLPHHAPVSTGPSGGRQRVTKNSRKSKPRTTGFNRETGEGMMTSVCGTVTPAKGTPATRANKKGNFCCPRCNSNFTRARSVKDHFISCVRKHGNPNGLSWWDHQTLEGSKNWHSDRRPTLNEDDEMESEEDGDEQESGNEQEQDEEESHGDDHGRYAQAIESDVATGEEDVDGDSRLGEEDQGRYNSVNAGRTLFHMSNERRPHYASNQGAHLYAPNQGSIIPGYGPNGYRTPVPTNSRGLSSYPPYQGGSYTPGFGHGYERPAQGFAYESNPSRHTDIIHRRETQGYGDQAPTPVNEEDDEDSFVRRAKRMRMSGQ